MPYLSKVLIINKARKFGIFLKNYFKTVIFINFYMMSETDSILTLKHMIQYTHQTL
jgi:hypothetical protein